MLLPDHKKPEDREAKEPIGGYLPELPLDASQLEPLLYLGTSPPSVEIDCCEGDGKVFIFHGDRSVCRISACALRSSSGSVKLRLLILGRCGRAEPGTATSSSRDTCSWLVLPRSEGRPESRLRRSSLTRGVLILGVLGGVGSHGKGFPCCLMSSESRLPSDGVARFVTLVGRDILSACDVGLTDRPSSDSSPPDASSMIGKGSFPDCLLYSSLPTSSSTCSSKGNPLLDPAARTRASSTGINPGVTSLAISPGMMGVVTIGVPTAALFTYLFRRGGGPFWACPGTLAEAIDIK